MTQLADPLAPNRGEMWSSASLIAMAAVAGALLGAVDLIAQRELPYPWANLANSAATWAVAAFAFGAWTHRRTAIAAAAGATMLVVAVESYYATAAIVQGDSWSILTSATAAFWLAAGVVGGMVMAPAGGWARTASGWRGVVGIAAPVSIFIAEAAWLLKRGGSAPQDGLRSHDTQTAGMEGGLAVLVLIVCLVGRRRKRDR